MERRILLVYCGWELTNIFLGGVLSGSLVRCADGLSAGHNALFLAWPSHLLLGAVLAAQQLLALCMQPPV
jgi:hypothetical protein